MSTSDRCPRCGADNRCGIASSEPCWCATLPPALPVPASGTSCYCRACLEALMAEAEAKISAPAAPAPVRGE